MLRQTKLTFNHITRYDSASPFSGLTFALRTDADHATKVLKASLTNHFNNAANPVMAEKVRHTVHEAYQKWGHSILKALSIALDYNSYGLTEPQNQFLSVHFYNAKSLAKRAIENGAILVEQNRGRKKEAPVFYVSLDDMIEPKEAYSGEIAFSRLFTHGGWQQYGYVARPGKPPLEEQLRTVRDIAKTYHKEHGTKLSIVLLEDNVRHAKMLNWVISRMDDSGIFKHARLGGISTCFCSASEFERNFITWKGRVVPLASVVDYGDAAVDVVTPRDLLFDGRVVEYEDKTEIKIGRLPEPFMNTLDMFRLRAEERGDYKDRVLKANIKFCETLERKLGVDIPLKWFAVAPAVAATTGFSPDDRMVDVLKKNHPRLQRP